MMGPMRNSSRFSGVDQERHEFVCFTMKNDKISTDAPDSFSRDERGFEFRNGLMIMKIQYSRARVFKAYGIDMQPLRSSGNSIRRSEAVLGPERTCAP